MQALREEPKILEKDQDFRFRSGGSYSLFSCQQSSFFLDNIKSSGFKKP